MFCLFRSPVFVRRALCCAAAFRLRGRGSRGSGSGPVLCCWWRLSVPGAGGVVFCGLENPGKGASAKVRGLLLIFFPLSLSGCACVQVTISSAIPFFLPEHFSLEIRCMMMMTREPKKEEERIPKPSLSCSVSSAAPPWIRRALDCFLPPSSSQFFFVFGGGFLMSK